MALALIYWKVVIGLPEKVQVFAFTSLQHMRFCKHYLLIINKLFFATI
jgi:hypothetical protein